MTGLKVLGLWSGKSSETVGARTGSPCHRHHYRVGMGKQQGFRDGRDITIHHCEAPPPQTPLIEGRIWKDDSRNGDSTEPRVQVDQVTVDRPSS